MHISKLTSNADTQREILSFAESLIQASLSDSNRDSVKNWLFYPLVKEQVYSVFSDAATPIAQLLIADSLANIATDAGGGDILDICTQFLVEYMIDSAYGRTLGDPEPSNLRQKLKPCKGVSFRCFNHKILYFQSKTLVNALRSMGFEATPENDGILAYGYIDQQAGLSFKGLCCANIGVDGKMNLSPTCPTASISIRAETITDACYFDMLETNTDLCEFTQTITITKKFYEDSIAPNVRMVREFTFLDPLRSDHYPDDIQVTLFKEGLQPELVWVRCTNADKITGVFFGRLLNQPYNDYGCHCGQIIAFQYIVDSNGSPVCLYISDQEHTDAKQQNTAKEKWLDLEDYGFHNYLDYNIVDYDDGDITITGVVIGVEDTDKFIDEVDFSDGITIPHWFDTFPEDEDTGNVIGLADYAFSQLRELSKIIIPDGVLTIGKEAFSECANLAEVDLPSSLRYIGMDAFSGCEKLKHITLPECLEVISQGAFSCSGLTNIRIPPNVKWIGPGAFDSCEQLKEIIILNPTIKIDEDAFCGCSALKTVIAPSTLAPQLVGQLNCNGISPEYIWLKEKTEGSSKPIVACRILSVKQETYTDGSSGTTAIFELTNNSSKEIILDVPEVFLVFTHAIHCHDFWLEDHIVKKTTLCPHQSIRCASIFHNDKSTIASVDGAKIGIVYTINKDTLEDDERADRVCEYGGYSFQPGAWTNLLELDRWGYFGSIFEKGLGGWQQIVSDIPACNDTTGGDIPEILFADFVVRVSLFRCLHNHYIEPIQAFVNVLQPNGSVVREQVSAGYCHECQCYFILEHDFLQFQKKGKLLCQLITEPEYLAKGDSIFSGVDMKAESVLHRCGYTVNAKDALSDQQRQGILMQVVNNGIYSVSELCAFLDWLIDYHGSSKTRNMKPAVSKWLADREFIKNYRINSRRQVGINGITY